MARTRMERIEELQRFICGCLDDGEEQEAYWAECELQALFDEQEQEEYWNERRG